MDIFILAGGVHADFFCPDVLFIQSEKPDLLCTYNSSDLNS
jgi:hypothetical protein